MGNYLIETLAKLSPGFYCLLEEDQSDHISILQSSLGFTENGIHVLIFTAAADEKIKNQSKSDTRSFEDQVKFRQSVMDIDDTSFVQSSFVSNRGVCTL